MSANQPQDLRLERDLLGSCLLRPEAIAALGLTADDFSTAANQALWDALSAMAAAGERVDPVRLRSKLMDLGTLEVAGGEAAIEKLRYVGKPSALPIERLQQLAKMRRLRLAAEQVAATCATGDLDASVAALADAHGAAMAGVQKKRTQNALDLCMPLLEELAAGREDVPRIHPGYELMEECLGSIPEGCTIAILASTNVGKALRASEPVLTPSGWVAIGMLNVGDLVVGVDGKPTEVTGVYHQGERDIFRVHFDDGAHVDADGDHLWSVRTDSDCSLGREWRTKTTSDIAAAGLRDKNGRIVWRIPIVDPVEHPTADLLVDPYLLGVLLGDGCFHRSGIGLSKRDDPEVLDRCRIGLPAGLEIRREAGATGERGCHRITGKHRSGNPLLEAIRDLGLGGLHSPEKFIPASYMHSSIEQRHALLQGLLDTDGTTDATGRYLGFCTTAPLLRDGVVELVRSLGGIARVAVKQKPFYKNAQGERVECRPAFIISIALPPEVLPFTCRRKADRFKPRTVRMPSRKIVAVEPMGRDQAVCIRVAHPRALYVSRDHVVTHNSGVSLEMLIRAAQRNVSCGYLSVEDQEPVVRSRIVGMMSGVSSRKILQRRLDHSDMAKFALAFEALAVIKNKLHVSILQGGTDADVCAAMSDLAARGAKLVVVDYLQKLRGSTSRLNKAHEVSDIATRITSHAQRLGLVCVLVSQCTRDKTRLNECPSKHDMKESGDLENMVDAIIGLWREYEDDTAPVWARLLKVKWGGVGQSWRIMRDPETGRLEEVPGSDRETPPTAARGQQHSGQRHR